MYPVYVYVPSCHKNQCAIFINASITLLEEICTLVCSSYHDNRVSSTKLHVFNETLRAHAFSLVFPGTPRCRCQITHVERVSKRYFSFCARSYIKFPHAAARQRNNLIKIQQGAFICLLEIQAWLHGRRKSLPLFRASPPVEGVYREGTQFIAARNEDKRRVFAAFVALPRWMA